MPIKVNLKNKNNSIENYLNECQDLLEIEKLEQIANESLKKFVLASPTKEIAESWSYEIMHKKNKVSLIFNNSQIQNGENVAIIIDVGHGTKEGYWISGKNYLSKPIKDTYDKIIKETWEVLKAYERH